MRLGEHLSRSFSIERGIRQGSVFPLTLFNIVMEPLLSNLKDRSLGLSINGLFIGALAHTDHIRTLASNSEDSNQMIVVHSFSDCKDLKFITEKCVLVLLV